MEKVKFAQAVKVGAGHTLGAVIVLVALGYLAQQAGLIEVENGRVTIPAGAGELATQALAAGATTATRCNR